MTLGSVVPIYAAVDMSPSLAGRGGEVLTTLLPECLDHLRGSEIGESVRCSVVVFADEARPVSRLTDWRHLDLAPPASTGTGTSFAALFRFLRGEIADDVQLLQADGTSVADVVILLFSDGQVTGEWSTEYEALFTVRPPVSTPHIVPIGVGDVDWWLMSQMGTLSAGQVIAASSPSAAAEVCRVIEQVVLGG